jgi:hypothetical protein
MSSMNRLTSAGTLTASKNEQRARRGKLSLRCAEELLPYRHTSNARIAKKTLGFFEVNSRRRNEARDNPIGKSRNKIGFKSQCWNAHQNSRHHSRAGGISTNTDHDVWPKLCKDRAASERGERNACESLRATDDAHVFELSNLNEAKRKSSLRHQASLDPAAGTDEYHLRGMALAQLASNG